MMDLTPTFHTRTIHGHRLAALAPFRQRPPHHARPVGIVLAHPHLSRLRPRRDRRAERASASLHSKDHVARERAAGRCDFDGTGSRAMGHQCGDFGTRHNRESRRPAVKIDTGRACKIRSEDGDFGSNLASAGQRFHKRR